jgi:hypothetical protein
MAKKSTPTPRAFDPQAGQAAFNELEATLRAMPADQVGIPNSDVQDSAVAALNLVDVVRDPKRRARLGLLPIELFRPEVVDQLEKASWAAWYLHTQVRTESATASGAKVDAALYEASGQHLTKLLRMLDYHVGSIGDVAAELADIRSGTGYQDRASDLARAADLWQRYRSELEADTRHFDPTDGDQARRYAETIVRALRDSLGSSVAQRADLRNRAYTLVFRLYNEVRAACLFLFRDDRAQLDLFPALRKVVIGPRPRPRPETPANGSPTPDGPPPVPAA